MGYVIAAYAIVIGSLAVYGLWVQRERRALARDTGRRVAPDASRTAV